ncbi:penicillin acylase family protein [Escherichia coli]
MASSLAWTHQMKAKNWQEWTQQAAKQALTINWYYADVNGNIGYVHTGAYPDRQSGHDPRLPVWYGKMGLERAIAFQMNPKVYNPCREILLTGKFSPKRLSRFGSVCLFVGGGRIALGNHRLLEQKPRLTADQAWDVIRQTSRQDLNLRLFYLLCKQRHLV